MTNNNKSIVGNQTDTHQDHLSFDPVIDSQTSVANTISDIVKDTFAQFKLFDSAWSDFPIEKVQSQTYFYDRIDLFKILFSDNLTGIV